jgi:hypothetical protein
MSLLDRLKRRRYFRYDLFVNDGNGWKKFGDFKEYMDYDDIENPDPGTLLKFYGVYSDSTQKDGWARKSLWQQEVPMPGGGRVTVGAGGKKEAPIEERLMEKIIEGADFSGLKPSKMSLPFGKSGGALEFESPVHIPGGGENDGYIIVDGARYPMGEISPLEFEGKLPAFLHPAASGMIMALMDKGAGIIKSAIGGAITETTGIKVKNPVPGGNTESTKIETQAEPLNPIDELDSLLDAEDDKIIEKLEKKDKTDVKKEKDKKKVSKDEK